MDTSTISIEVPVETAQAFGSVPSDERRKLEVLLSLRLSELVGGPPRPIAEIMDEIGARANAHGLTPEILNGLLRDK
jgi:hypothetical protein